MGYIWLTPPPPHLSETKFFWIPGIWYIAVADRFTRTEITYIQVTLPLYLKLHNANIFGVPLYKASKWGLHPYIFNVNIRFCVHYIPGLQKSFVEMWGGGGAW